MLEVEISNRQSGSRDLEQRRLDFFYRRWRSVISIGAISGVFFLVLTSWQPNLFKLIVAMPIWIGACIGVVMSVAIAQLGWHQVSSLLGLRRPLQHPTILIAVLVGILIIIAFGLFSVRVRMTLGLAEDSIQDLEALLIVGTELLFGLGAVSAIRAESTSRTAVLRRHVTHERTALRNPSPPQFEGLKAWFADDAPLERPEQDRFGHIQIARRIVSRLTSSEKPRSQAVIGQLGAGKTSLFWLVRSMINEQQSSNESVRMVHVELWPYETSAAAVRGILDALVKELPREATFPELLSLPSKYLIAMGEAGGLLSAFSKLVGGVPSNPWDLLERIDQIAVAARIKFVLWIDDLERFAPGESDERDATRLQPIRALLYCLSQCDSISVITATTKLSARLDENKIAEHIETLPGISAQDAAGILRAFREGCRSEKDYLRAAPPMPRALDNLGMPSKYLILRQHGHDDRMELSDAIVAMASTPRTLKSGLRQCYESWDILRGEIDFDDLLVMSLLRTTKPVLFALVYDNIDYLRSRAATQESPSDSKDTPWLSAVEAAQLDRVDRQILDAVVAETFNILRREDGEQGLGSQTSNYWRVFLDALPLSAEESDQRFLRVIRTDETDEIMALLENPMLAEKVLQFSAWLKSHRILDLLGSSVHRDFDWQNYQAPQDPPPQFRVLRDILERRRRSSNGPDVHELVQVLRSCIDTAIQKSLIMAVQFERTIIRQLTDGDDAMRMMVSELDNNMRARFAERYIGRAALLAMQLKDADGGTLALLVFGRDQLRAGKNTLRVNLPNPEAVASTILEAIRISPEIMLPQLALLIADRSQPITDSEPLQSFHISMKQARLVFGDLQELFAALPTQIPDELANSMGVRELYSAMRSMPREDYPR